MQRGRAPKQAEKPASAELSSRSVFSGLPVLRGISARLEAFFGAADFLSPAAFPFCLSLLLFQVERKSPRITAGAVFSRTDKKEESIVKEMENFLVELFWTHGIFIVVACFVVGEMLKPIRRMFYTSSRRHPTTRGYRTMHWRAG